MKSLKIALYVLLGLAVLLLIVPLLIPVPPLPNLRPAEELADADSRFVELAGVKVHYKLAGQGEPALVLLHGFGASIFSWREVLAPLAAQSTVLAYDRPAFGLTSRPVGAALNQHNPYTPEAQVALTLALLDHFGIQQAILVGNSAGGTIATQFALRHPQRVRALILVDAAIYTGGGAPGFLRSLLRTPQARHLGPLIARSLASRSEAFLASAWHDPSKITPEIREGYSKPLQVQDWDRALWEFTLASQAPNLAGRLWEIQVPVLVITGDDDRIVPTEQSVRLAAELPQAELVVIPNCGHVPQEECPEAFLQAVTDFMERLSPSAAR